MTIQETIDELESILAVIEADSDEFVYVLDAVMALKKKQVSGVSQAVKASDLVVAHPLDSGLGVLTLSTSSCHLSRTSPDSLMPSRIAALMTWYVIQQPSIRASRAIPNSRARRRFISASKCCAQVVFMARVVSVEGLAV